jgi:hypothetical protein
VTGHRRKFVSLPAKALAPVAQADPGSWDRQVTTEQLVEFGRDRLVILAAVRGNRSTAPPVWDALGRGNCVHIRAAYRVHVYTLSRA